MGTALVTAANGFIGRHLCRHLLDAGWVVKGAVRRPDAVRELPLGVTGVAIGDVGPETEWDQALEDVDVVVHLAARVHVMSEKNRNRDQALWIYRLVNVEGTRRLVESCLRAGVRRFVYMSSVKAVGEGDLSSQRPYVESDPCRPVDPYGISKMEAEKIVLAAGEARGLEAVILRAPLVYGPGVKGNFLRLLRALDRGMPIPVATVRNARSMIYVGNLVDIIRVSMEHPRAAGGIFFVADGEPLSTRELVRRLSRHLGRRAYIIPVPVGVLRFLGWCLGKRAEVDRLVGCLVVDTRAVRNALGWEPPFDVEHGLAETVRWFRGDGDSGAQGQPQRTAND